MYLAIDSDTSQFILVKLNVFKVKDIILSLTYSDTKSQTAACYINKQSLTSWMMTHVSFLVYLVPWLPEQAIKQISVWEKCSVNVIWQASRGKLIS